MSLETIHEEVPASPFNDEPIEIEDEELEEDELNEELDEESYDDEEDIEDIEEFDDDDIDEELEDDEDDDDSLSDEEIDALLDELIDDEDDEEVVDTVPHAALHKERERRKEVQATLTEQQQLLSESDATISNYKETLADIKSQLKELGMDDVVSFDSPAEVPKEVLEMRRQKEAVQQQEQITTMVNDLRGEAIQHIDEFPQIDGDDSEQAELILGFAMASTMLGADKEDAVIKAMTILNKHLASAKKSVKRPVQRAKAPTRVSKRRAPSSVRSSIKKGNIKGVFDSYADDMMS